MLRRCDAIWGIGGSWGRAAKWSCAFFGAVARGGNAPRASLGVCVPSWAPFEPHAPCTRAPHWCRLFGGTAEGRAPPLHLPNGGGEFGEGRRSLCCGPLRQSRGRLWPGGAGFVCAAICSLGPSRTRTFFARCTRIRGSQVMPLLLPLSFPPEQTQGMAPSPRPRTAPTLRCPSPRSTWTPRRRCLGSRGS